MRERTERIHGPFKHRNKWRLRITAADGTRSYRSYPSEAEALADLALYREEFDGRTVSAAVDEYLEHLRSRGRKASTVTTARYRLRGLLRVADRDLPLTRLTVAAAKRLLEQRRDETSADTQHGEIAVASTFASWCVAQGWLPGDPFADLEASGPRATGKDQLRIDEARRFVEVALNEGSKHGLAAAIALLLGCRASEITDRVVRDVDDGARVLWIERGKTRSATRQLEVPECLRQRLTELCAGRRPDERLFGLNERGNPCDRHWLLRHAKRFCRAAGVPVITVHGLRGTQASLAVRAAPAEHVAAQLGQVGPAVTRRHYFAPGAEQTGRQRAALSVLIGGAA